MFYSFLFLDLLLLFAMPTDTPPKRSTRSSSNIAPLNLNDIKRLIDNARNEIINIFQNEVGVFRTTIDNLKTMICELQSENRDLRAKCMKVEEELRSHRMTMMCEITDEFENRGRCSRNVIISDIPESSPNS